jgi:hypothetical protein
MLVRTATKTVRKAAALCGLFFAVSAASVSTADANPVLRIIDSTVPVTIDVVDDGAGDLATPVPGLISTLYGSGVFGANF